MPRRPAPSPALADGGDQAGADLEPPFDPAQAPLLIAIAAGPARGGPHIHGEATQHDRGRPVRAEHGPQGARPGPRLRLPEPPFARAGEGAAGDPLRAGLGRGDGLRPPGRNGPVGADGPGAGGVRWRVREQEGLHRRGRAPFGDAGGGGRIRRAAQAAGRGGGSCEGSIVGKGGAVGKAKDNGVVQAIREGIRDTVRDTLRSVVQEATDQEPRTALREEDIRKSILDLMRQELHAAMQGLHPRAKRSSRGS